MKQQIYNTAIYLRLSRDDELHGESAGISTQRQMLTQYCQDNGLRIVGEYADDGWSETNYDRPQFLRMIEDIEDGKINCVITKDLSRLGRNYILTGQYNRYLRSGHGFCPAKKERTDMRSSLTAPRFSRKGADKAPILDVFPTRRCVTYR